MMRTVLGSAILAAAAIIAAGRAFAGESPAIGQITDRLNAALECTTLDQANARVAEAQGLLDQNKLSLSRAARVFLQAEIARVKGAVTMNLLPADPAESRVARHAACKLFQEALTFYQAVQEQQPGSSDAERFCIAAERSMAWAEYGLACSLDDGPERIEHLESALHIFQTFTASGGVDPAVMDCLLGQARCLDGLSRSGDIIGLLEPVIWSDLPPAYAREFARLLVQACREQRRNLKLHQVAALYFAKPRAGRALDAVDREIAREWARSLAVLLAGCPESCRPPLREAAEKALGLLSIIGESCPELEVAASTDGGGSTTVHLSRARRLFGAGTWADALSSAEAGLKAATPATPPAVLADLRYIRFAAQWNLQHLADSFRAAAEFLANHPSDARRAEVCDRAVDAALDAEPAIAPAELKRVLASIAKQLAGRPELAWYRGALLLAAKDYPQAEAALNELQPASPMYRRACYCLARAAWEQNQPARAADALKRFAALPGKPNDADLPCVERAAAMALSVAETMLQADPPDAAAARDLLAAASGLRSDSPPTAVKRAVLRVRADLILGDTGRLMSYLDGLSASNDTKLRAWASADLARDLEAAYQRLANAGKTEEVAGLHNPLMLVYGSLLTIALAEKNRPQELALRRHVALNVLRAGKHKEALEAYKLLEKDLAPEQPGDVLLGLAISCEQTGSPGEAVGYWQALCTGLPEESDEWLEARCRLIECYCASGQVEHARKVLEYFKLQRPNLAEKWRAKIEELERAVQ